MTTRADDSNSDQQTASREMLLVQVRGARRRFRRGSAAWALAYHGSLFGAAILSAAAALLIKVPPAPLEDLAAVSATIAALLTTLSSVGNFQTKWFGNRNAFHALDELLIDVDDPEVAISDLRREFKRVVHVQQTAWIGDQLSSPAQQPQSRE
jgi:hypothetical protein